MEVGLEIGKGFGKVVRVFLGSKLVIFLSDPADIEVR